MNVVISPAKKLDFQTPCKTKTTSPALLKKTKVLLSVLKKCSLVEIKKMMKLSDSLASLNYDRFQNYATTTESNAAVFAFNGDTYKGLDAHSLTEGDLSYAQEHLHILSGLYGVLRPLDKIRPYRLEMGTRFSILDHSNLYQFWDQTITGALNESVSLGEGNILVNCASEEYFKSVKRELCEFKIIDIRFLELKNGEYKVISFMAKKARGMMARYIIQKKIKTLAKLRKFDLGGYCYSEQESSEELIVFKRQ